MRRCRPRVKHCVFNPHDRLLEPSAKEVSRPVIPCFEALSAENAAQLSYETSRAPGGVAGAARTCEYPPGFMIKGAHLFVS